MSSLTATKRVLWVDDHVALFGGHIASLRDKDYDVFVVSTAHDALAEISQSTEPFDAIIVDLRLVDADGFVLLETLYERIDVNRTKIVVLSSFLYDAKIQQRLMRLNMNVALLDKTFDFADRLQGVLDDASAALPMRDQLERWDAAATSLDPFHISFESYLNSSLAVRVQLDLRAQELTRVKRAALRQDGVVWALFCGSADEPVETMKKLEDIPSENEVFQVAIKLGHPPYESYGRGQFEEIASGPPEPEDALWAGGGCPGLSDYPFLRIGVYHPSTNVRISRDLHFDTGLDFTAFDVDTALRFGFEVENKRPSKFAEYAGYDLAYYDFAGQGYLEQHDFGELAVSVRGHAFLNWAKTPFCRECASVGCSEEGICRRRRGLLGRNLLIDNRLLLALRRG